MDSYQGLLYLPEVRELSASFGSGNTGHDPADSRASFWTNQLAGFALSKTGFSTQLACGKRQREGGLALLP